MVKVDVKKCIGCGLCASICSDVFELVGGHAQVKKKANLKATCIADAISQCPVSAISK